jgi:integrase/recombinase XerD
MGQFQDWLATECVARGGRTLAVQTQVAVLHAVRTYYRFLRQERYIQFDLVKNMQMPKAPHVLPRPGVTLDDVHQLLRMPAKTPGALRDRAVLFLLASSGVRATELCDLQTEDVDLKSREVTIRSGKGSYGRVTFMVAKAARAIEAYLLHARQILLVDNHAILFIDDEGNPMDRYEVNRVMKRMAGKAGLKKPFSAHMLRHFVCTVLLREGADIRVIAKVAGHRRLSTTSRYARVDADLMRKTYEQAHPRAMS